MKQEHVFCTEPDQGISGYCSIEQKQAKVNGSVSRQWKASGR